MRLWPPKTNLKSLTNVPMKDSVCTPNDFLSGTRLSKKEKPETQGVSDSLIGSPFSVRPAAVPTHAAPDSPNPHADPEQGRKTVEMRQIIAQVHEMIEHGLTLLDGLLECGQGHSRLLGRFSVTQLPGLDCLHRPLQSSGLCRVVRELRAPDVFSFPASSIHAGHHPLANQLQFELRETG